MGSKHSAVVAAVATLLWLVSNAVATEPPGKQLYHHYCASCHGIDGTGDGPVAASLRTQPTDLTTLALRNGGRFDLPAVITVIDGRRQVAAHGPREMPVWGAIFVEESEGPYPEYTTLLRAKTLADYIESIQKK